MNTLAIILWLVAAPTEHIRCAEYVARINAAGERAGALIADGLAGDDPAAQSAAMQAAHDFYDTRRLAALLPTVSPPVQVALLGLLARRGDPVAMPSVVALARSANTEVRAAALRALGPLGDASVVRLLAEAAANGETAARQALLELRRGDVGAAMVAEWASPPLQKELARALAQRAEPATVGPMMKLYLETGNETLREALRQVCQRSRSAAEPVLAALTEGNAGALLPVCGGLVDPRVRVVLRRVGGRALCGTKDPELVPELIELARVSDDAAVRALAFRAAARLSKGAASFRQLLALAKGPEEKRLVLAGLAALRDAEALKMALSLCEDVEVGAEAAEAARQLREALAKPEWLTNWEVAGPYRQEGKNFSQLFEIVFPPETEEVGAVRWKVLPAESPVDLQKALGDGEQCVAYARTRVLSDKEQPARLEIGSDDGVKVWWNGQPVFARNVARLLTPGEEKVNVTLRPGVNTLMLKITQNNLGWAFCVRLVK